MAFDIDGARKAGYTSSEIADYMGKDSGFDAAAAQKSGYTPDEIIGHLSAAKAPAKAPAKPVESSNIATSDPMGSGFAEATSAPAPVEKSIFNDVKMDAPDVDAEANRQARNRSVSPNSVMFTPARSLDKIDKAVVKYKKQQADLPPPPSTFDDTTSAIAASGRGMYRTGQNLGLSLIGAINNGRDSDTDDSITKTIGQNIKDEEKEYRPQTGTGRFAGAVTDLSAGLLVSMINPVLGGAMFATQFGFKAGEDAINNGNTLLNAQFKGAVNAFTGSVGGSMLVGGMSKALSSLPIVGRIFAEGAADTGTALANRMAQSTAAAGVFSFGTRAGNLLSDNATGEMGIIEDPETGHMRRKTRMDYFSEFDPATELFPMLFLGMAHGIPEYAKRNKMGTASAFRLGEGDDITVNVAHANGSLFSSPAAAEAFAKANAETLGGEATIVPVTRKQVSPESKTDDTVGFALDITGNIKGKAKEAADLQLRSAELEKTGGKYTFDDADKQNILGQARDTVNEITNKAIERPLSEQEQADHSFLTEALQAQDHESLARKLNYAPGERSLLTPAEDPGAIFRANTAADIGKAAEASVPNIDLTAVNANHLNRLESLPTRSTASEPSNEALYDPSKEVQVTGAPRIKAAPEVSDRGLIDSLNSAAVVTASRDGLPGKTATPYTGPVTEQTKTVQLIADAIGQRVVLVDGAFNGVYHNGAIFLNPNSPRAQLAVVGHELAHRLENENPNEYQKLKDIISPLVGNETLQKKLGVYFPGIAEGQHTDAHKDYVMTEATNDIIGNRMADKSFWTVLAAKDKSVFAAMAGHFKSMLEAVKGKLFETGVKAPELDKAHAMIDSVMGKYLGDKAVEKANETARADAESRAKFSLDDYDGMDELGNFSGKDAYNEGIDVDESFNDADLQNFDTEFRSAKERQLQRELAKSQVVVKQDPMDVTADQIKKAGLRAENAVDIKPPTENDDGSLSFKVEGLIKYAANSITKGQGDSYTLRTPNSFVSGSLVPRPNKQGAIDFVKRLLASQVLHEKGFDIASTYRKNTVQKLVDVWRKFADQPEAFKYKVGDDTGKEFTNVSGDMNAFKGYRVSVEEFAPGMHFVTFKTQSGQRFQADLTETGKQLTACTMNLSGSNLGTEFYAVAGEYAKRRGLQFHADGMLSGINTYRRTEQATSFALKTGDSSVLLPGDDNRVYGFKTARNLTKEENDQNLGRLLLAGMRNAEEIIPDIRNYSYDPKTDKFRDYAGKDANATIDKMLEGQNARAFGMGRSTLARALMTSDIIKGKITVDDVGSFAKPVLYSLDAGTDHPVSEAWGAEGNPVPAVEKFMAKSTIKRDDGTPIQMYHGTAGDITEFRAKQAGAIFVTDTPNFAHIFADSSAEYMARNYSQFLSKEQIQKAQDEAVKSVMADASMKLAYRKELVSQIKGDNPRGEAQDALMEKIKDQMPSGENIMPLIVNAEHPFDYKNKQHVDDLLSQIHADNPEISYDRAILDQTPLAEGIREGSWEKIESPMVQQAIHALGHDSFYVQEMGKRNLAVYDPRQLKSAIGNNGDYDPTNPDIRYSLESPEFKTFFDGSKVVDRAGDPMRVYHATNKDFSKFDVKRSDWDNLLGQAFYFDARPKEVQKYAEGDGGNIMPVYLNIKNPATKEQAFAVIDKLGSREKFIPVDEAEHRALQQKGFEIMRTQGEDAFDKYWSDIDKQRADARENTGIKAPKKTDFRDALEAAGFDGVKAGTTWVALRSEQIKSAIGNNGNYDASKSDIRYSLEGFKDSTPEERKAFKVPPAWTDVQVSTSPNPRVTAMGINARGEKVRMYSAAHAGEALTNKFERLRSFNQDRPELLQRIDEDAANGNEAAKILQLMAHTGFRIGGKVDRVEGKEAYGATTLKPEHVLVDGDKVAFNFTGKGGVNQAHEIEHAGIAATLSGRMNQEKIFNVTNTTVRRYFDSIIDDREYVPHDFRSWNATDTAIKAINSEDVPRTPAAFWLAYDRVGDAAAQKIGDKRKTALESYVDPKIFDEWRTQANVPEGAARPEVRARKGKAREDGQVLPDPLNRFVSDGSGAEGNLPKFSLDKPSNAKEMAESFREEVVRKLAPLSEAPQESRAIIKQFANDRRLAQYNLGRFDEFLKTDFTEAQQEKMWNAADEENVLRQTAKSPSEMIGKGLDSLNDKERAVVVAMHEHGEALLQRAKDAGMFQGEGLPFWTPRMMALIDADGVYHSASEGKGSGENGLKFSTTASSFKNRKYVYADETEAAMKKVGNEKGLEGQLVRNIRTMPMAMARMENAVAGRELVDQIKAMGKTVGQEWLSNSAKEGFVVAQNAAFTTYKPQFETDSSGRPIKDSFDRFIPKFDAYGSPLMDKHPMYVRRDIDAALRAVLSSNDGAAYTAYMLLKSKAMGAIMISPLIHNMVIGAKAAALHPFTFPALYVNGFFARKDPSLVQNAIKNGLVLVAQHNTAMDVTDITSPLGKAGGIGDMNESLFAHAMGKVFGETVKGAIDKAGDFWHGTLLWNRIADLQMGIFENSRKSLIKEGYSNTAASIIAAHLGNRYGGALPKENMSEIARKFANVVLFSRSFTLGNIGIMKDMVTGLPAGERALLEREMGEDAAKGIGKARRIALSGYIADVGMMYIVTSLVQDAIDDKNKKRSVVEIMGDYGDRAKAMKDRIGEHPFRPGSYDPLQLFSQGNNEPGKDNRARLGESDNFRQIYLRVPTGKVAEELIGWITHPADVISAKLSPTVKSLFQVASNDKGYSKPVYDPEDHLLGAKGAAIIKHIVNAHMNGDVLQTAYDVYKGVGTDVDKLKLMGTATGFTPSQGFPGGQEAGVMNKAEQEFKTRVALSKEDAYRALKYGDYDKAQTIMEKTGMTNKEINTFIQKYAKPADKPSKSMTSRFNKHATEDDRQKMESMR